MFGRRSSAESSSTPAIEDPAARADGKGRATPTRKEAQAARKERLSPPRGRKELAAKQRAERREYRKRQQVALSTGDDKYLPSRDKGPVRRYVRDYVDSKRCIGEIMVPLFLIVLAVSLVTPAAVAQYAAVAWILIIGAMAADGLRIARGVKAGIRQRFGDAETKGITWYALMRAWQMRRLRLPKPQVKAGAQV